MTPPLTASGRVSRPKSWQAALEHGLRGHGFERTTVCALAPSHQRFRSVAVPSRAEDFAAQEPEQSAAVLLGFASDAFEMGDTEAAHHFARLADDLAEWVESVRWDAPTPFDDPWVVSDEKQPDATPKEVPSMSLQDAIAALESAGYTVKPARKAAERKRRAIVTLTREECDALLAACDSNRQEIARVRDRAIFSLMLASGIRVGELCALHADAVSVDGRIATIQVPDDPGCKCGARTAGFYWLDAQGNPTQAALALAAWYKTRDDCPTLFHTRSGERMIQPAIDRSIKRIGRVAGIEKKLHAHMLRHTFATQMSETCTQAEIAALLGHKSVATSAVYVHTQGVKDVLARH